MNIVPYLHTVIARVINSKKGISSSVACQEDCARVSSPRAVILHSSGSIAAERMHYLRRAVALQGEALLLKVR